MTDHVLAFQINRLLRLPFAPNDDEARKALKAEYRRVLRTCKSDAHLVAVVDYLMDTSARVPPPVEVRTAINETMASYKAPSPSPDGIDPYREWRPSWKVTS